MAVRFKGLYTGTAKAPMPFPGSDGMRLSIMKPGPRVGLCQSLSSDHRATYGCLTMKSESPEMS